MKKVLTTLTLVALSGCAAQSGWRPTVNNGPQYGYGGYQPAYGAPQVPQAPQVPAGGYYQNAQQGGYYQNPQNPPPPPAGNANARLAQDQYDCDIQARAAANPNMGERATDALTGGVVGAALGAAIGAVAGDPGKGAAIGAAAVGIGNTARGAINADAEYKRAYSNCLNGRGHNVVNQY